MGQLDIDADYAILHGEVADLHFYRRRRFKESEGVQVEEGVTHGDCIDAGSRINGP
jgi:hypothetical protein